jgi:orotate phosphoribosyltransferase
VRKADDHVTGRMPGVHAHTAVAFFLGKLKMALHAPHVGQLAEIRRLRFDFLHTHTIRSRFFHPSSHAFGGCRTDAVEVQAGDAKQIFFHGAHAVDQMSKENEMNDLAIDFVRFSVQSGVLRFGEFKTKAGRLSPYFFNAGLFDDGEKLLRLAGFYAQRILQSGIQFDMLFGPAYKGIPLVAAVSMELARLGHNYPFAYNRKEAKDHGEGGTLVGAPVQGRVMIIDDVMSAGTAARESIAIIEQAGAKACAVAIALDRQEKATEVTPEGLRDVNHSAVQYVKDVLGLEVCAIAELQSLLQYLETTGASDASAQASRQAVLAYRQRYGVS